MDGHEAVRLPAMTGNLKNLPKKEKEKSKSKSCGAEDTTKPLSHVACGWSFG